MRTAVPSESPEQLRRIPGVDALDEQVAGDDGTGTDDDAVRDLDGQDGRIRADRDAVADRRRAPLAPVAPAGPPLANVSLTNITP